MKKILCVLAVTAFSLVAFTSAVTARDDDSTAPKPAGKKNPARSYDETYKMVCEGQNADQLCGKVNTEVNRSVADTLTAMRPVIHAAAKTYGVDPATIVGALLAEHSMNTGASDIAQDALVSLGLAKNGTLDFGFYKKTFTYGFGQLHFDRALEAEKIAAQIEQRPLRTSDQVNAALMTPEGAAYYAAALVRQAQDLYLGAGYDLSDDAATLTTLYNIGKINERLERTKREGRPPQPNYFGLFVLKNKDRISQIVGDYNPNADISLAKNKSQAPADSPYITRYRASENLMPLKSGMANIGANSAAFATGNFVLKEGDQFDLVGSIDDASLGTLHLVRNNEGKMGYLPEAVIAKKAKSILVNKSACAIDGSKKCLEDMETYLSEKEGETYAHMQEVSAPKKKPLSPREEILLKAQKQAEEMLTAFATQAFKKNGSAATDASKRIDNYLNQMAPVLEDYTSVANAKIESLVKKKETLEKMPKLEEGDLVEILGGIRDFRAKAARAQPDGMGILGSPYAVFEPLLEFYEACAVEHHGESAEIKEFFSNDAYASSFFGQRSYGVREALAYGGGDAKSKSSYDGNTFESWLANKLRFIRYGHKVPLTDSQQKGREGEKVRKNSGQNCYGDKEAFLGWLKSIPVRPNPGWKDLEPSYAKAAEFYNPIMNKNDLDYKIQAVPAEINQVKSNMAKNLETIQKYYPKLRERLLAMKKILEVTDAKEVAERHPAVQLLQSVRDQFRDCRLATMKDKELKDKLDAFDVELGGDITTLIRHYAGGNGANTRVVDYEMQDALAYLFRELFPNDYNSPNSVYNMFNDVVPVNVAMDSDVSNFLSRWAKLGKLLESSCGIFEDPLIDAYINHPELVPAGAETCTVEVLNKDSLSNRADIQKLQLSLLDIKQKFGDEKERFKFVKDSLSALGWSNRYGNNGGETAVKAARFPDYHSLAKELSEKDCVKAIFVSRVQELDLPKAVFVPSGNDSSIRVVWKGNKCN